MASTNKLDNLVRSNGRDASSNSFRALSAAAGVSKPEPQSKSVGPVGPAVHVRSVNGGFIVERSGEEYVATDVASLVDAVKECLGKSEEK